MTLLLISCALAMVLFVLGANAVTLWRLRHTHTTEMERLGALEQRLQQTISEVEARQHHKLTALGNSVGVLRSDVELIAGEWSVRQAVEMAMEGVDAATIERETGLETDDVRTILRVRPH